VSQNLFFHGIGFTRLGVSCYRAALLSNKPAYSVQFLKDTPPPPDRILDRCMRFRTYLFRKIALIVTTLFFDAAFTLVIVVSFISLLACLSLSLVMTCQPLMFIRTHHLLSAYLQSVA
jgi:hypothetical protein